MGTLWMMMYLAHDNWFTYLTPAGRAAGIKRGGKPPGMKLRRRRIITTPNSFTT